MNAFRKVRLFVLLGFVAVLTLGLSAAPAEAGGHHGHQHFHNFHHVSYPKYINYGHYCPTSYQPIIKYVVKPISYPATYYDCYGQPYVVWQTTYQTVPTTFYP
jgi:hypothetical protein